MITLEDVYVDDRETSRVIQKGKEIIPGLKVAHLPIGDVVSGNLAIERKAIGDFVGSVYDGRVFRQAVNMKLNFANSYIIIEGRFNDLHRHPNFNKFSLEHYTGSVASLTQNYGVPCITVENLNQFWRMVRKFIEKNDPDKVIEQNNIVQPKGDGVDMSHVMVVPGLGKKTAELILEEFTVYDLYHVNIDDLTKIRGIGQKTAENIKRCFPKESKVGGV
jgi:ERCC4-type nuclease